MSRVIHSETYVTSMLSIDTRSFCDHLSCSEKEPGRARPMRISRAGEAAPQNSESERWREAKMLAGYVKRVFRMGELRAVPRIGHGARTRIRGPAKDRCRWVEPGRRGRLRRSVSPVTYALRGEWYRGAQRQRYPFLGCHLSCCHASASCERLSSMKSWSRSQTRQGMASSIVRTM